MKFSIIIVTLNSEKYIEKTLESIFSQTYSNYEVLIIDGMSTDKTLNIIESYKNKITLIISEKDLGIYDAMNKGISLSKGKYINFLNTGDKYFNENVLEKVYNSIKTKPNLVYGDINIFNNNKYIKEQISLDFNFQNLIKKGTGVLCHQSMFVLNENIPLYNLKYKYKAELNWYFDLLKLKNFTYQKLKFKIVDYDMSGFGQINFLKNRIDWLKLIVDRFGYKTLFKSKLIIYLYYNSFYKYPLLKHLHLVFQLIYNILTSPLILFRKLKKKIHEKLP